MDSSSPSWCAHHDPLHGTSGSSCLAFMLSVFFVVNLATKYESNDMPCKKRVSDRGVSNNIRFSLFQVGYSSTVLATTT